MSNLLIIYKTCSVKAVTRNRASMNMLEVEEQKNLNEFHDNTCNSLDARTRHYSSQITKSLLIISLSYAILSLPYLVAWFLYFIEVAFKHSSLDENDLIRKNYLFAFLQISEVGFILNYSIHFYINCAFDSIFLKNLFDRTDRTIRRRTVKKWTKTSYYLFNLHK